MCSRKPTKQRKMFYKAPDHLRYKFFAAPLTPELNASRRVKTLPLRRGDTVLITRGDHKGFEGKITRINRKKYKIYVEGLTREKSDGTAIFVPVHPSKVMIKNLILDDKWRKKILKRKKEASKIKEEIVETKEKTMEQKLRVDQKGLVKKTRTRKRKAAVKPAVKEKGKETKKGKRKTVKKSEGGN